MTLRRSILPSLNVAWLTFVNGFVQWSVTSPPCVPSAMSC